MIWVFLIVLVPVAAWGMWLLFCANIAKQHGIDGLKATPPIARAFPVTAWVSSLRHVGPWVGKAIDHVKPPTPPADLPPDS